MRWCHLLFLTTVLACADHAQQAVALYDKGDYAGAAHAADTGLTAYPGDEGLWQMRVRAALAQGDAAGLHRAYAAYHDHRGGDDRALLRELSIATLDQALASPSVKLKLAAIRGVVAAEIEPLAEAVAARMGDDEDRVAAAAAIAILHADPRAPQLAGQMLHSEDAEARRIAVDGIGQKVGALALADLEQATTDRDPRVRRTAVYWLGRIKDRDAIRVVTARLGDHNDEVRAAAGLALAALAADNLPALAEPALADAALAVRLAGVTMLAASGAAGVATLTRLVDDPDPMVAAEAAIALGGGARAQPAITRAETATDWTTRAGAANLAMRALGKPAALALAHRLAGDPAPQVRLAAARVLAHAGEAPAAAEIFAAVLHDPSTPALAIDAAQDLADQRDPRGARALDALITNDTIAPDQRAQAAAAHTAAHVITPGLVAALADPDLVVRVEAADAIAVLARHDSDS